mgnify:CR=1 FL=1
MKKILVAGGAGYVGTRFCNEYCNIYDITVVDLFWFGDQLNNKIKKPMTFKMVPPVIWQVPVGMGCLLVHVAEP